MDDITRWAEIEQLLEPSWPFQGVTLDFDGGQLADPRVQEAFVAAIDQEAVTANAFPEEGIPFTAIIGNEPLEASAVAYDPERALALLEEAGYDRGQVVFIVFPEEDAEVSTAAKLIAGDLSRINIPIELVAIPLAELGGARNEFREAEMPFVILYR
jgi:ABC-type transport system substrate-binding protein